MPQMAYANNNNNVFIVERAVQPQPTAQPQVIYINNNNQPQQQVVEQKEEQSELEQLLTCWYVFRIISNLTLSHPPHQLCARLGTHCGIHLPVLLSVHLIILPYPGGKVAVFGFFLVFAVNFVGFVVYICHYYSALMGHYHGDLLISAHARLAFVHASPNASINPPALPCPLLSCLFTLLCSALRSLRWAGSQSTRLPCRVHPSAVHLNRLRMRVDNSLVAPNHDHQQLHHPARPP